MSEKLPRITARKAESPGKIIHSKIIKRILFENNLTAEKFKELMK